MPPFLVILLVVNVSAFSSILTKIAATDLSAAHYFLWRYLIAFLVMAFRFLFSKASLDYKSCKSGLMLGLVSVPLLFCWYQGLSLISASLSSFITSLSVIVVFIDRHRKLNLLPQWHHVIAVLTAFLGLSLLINEVHANFLGLCYSFFSALLGGVYFIWVGEIKKESFDSST